MNVDSLRTSVRQGRIEWRKHVLQRMVERGISQADVLDVLLSGSCIRDYSDDKPFPSALFLGYLRERPLHVVAALDEKAVMVFIITAYEPSLETFEPDFKTRKKDD